MDLLEKFATKKNALGTNQQGEKGSEGVFAISNTRPTPV
jgi:hypothetical protein